MHYRLALLTGLFSIICFFLVSGCEQQKDSRYFLTHPSEIQSTYEKCLMSSNNDTIQSKECSEVAKAIPVFKTYAAELMDNNWIYGLHLMRAEADLVKLQKSYYLAKAQSKDPQILTHLRNAINDKKLEIESRLALLRLLYKIR